MLPELNGNDQRIELIQEIHVVQLFPSFFGGEGLF